MEQNRLDEIGHRLRVPRRHKSAIQRELASHLADARHDLVLAGWKPADADREALARLGEPDEIAAGFTHVHRQSRRTQIGLALALATGMLLGAYGIGGQFASAHAIHPAQTHRVPRSQHALSLAPGHRACHPAPTR